MTTNNDFTMDKFASVCATAEEGFRLFKQTETIYNFLVANKGTEFSPTEIGLAIGRKPFIWHNSVEDVDVAASKMISDSLYWLYHLGLISRHIYTEKKTIKPYYPTKVKDVKVIDGVEYVGYIYKNLVEVNSTFCKWFAL